MGQKNSIRGSRPQLLKQAKTQEPNRRCVYCDRILSKWNSNEHCYACDEAIDDWDTLTYLPEHYEVRRLDEFPPPEPDEGSVEYIRRILVESDAAVQIYRLAKYHGYTRRQADTAFKVNNTWLKRRGLRLQPAGPRGSGHVVVDSDGAPVRKSDVRRKV